MLTYNTMRFGTDVFLVSDTSGDGGEEETTIGTRQALLVSGDYLDASNVSAVNKFVISGKTATSGNKRRIMLKIDNKYYTFVNGTLTEYSGEPTIENVLADGNTPADLTALSNISALVGKKIYPIIAIQSSSDENPAVKIGLNITTSVATKSKTVTSSQFTLNAPAGVVPKITGITVDDACTGSGSATVTVRLKDAEGNWGSYISLANAANKNATAVQFKIVYKVVNVGSDVAKVNSITVDYVANSETIAGDFSDIFSVIPNFETPLRLCYVVIRHKKLVDSTIEAFANFFPTPKHRERILVGNGTGDIAQYVLGVDGVPDAQIDHNSIRVYVDGVQTSSFDYNTEVSELSINATSGKSILVSYDYDCGLEDWRPMTKEFDQQPYLDDTYMTRFSYVLPDDVEASRANVRIRLGRPSGSVTNLSLGKATGKTQQIVLPHVAIPDTISLNADFTYNFDNRILTFVATKNTALKLSYDYRGEKHTIYSWAAGWAAA